MILVTSLTQEYISPRGVNCLYLPLTIDHEKLDSRKSRSWLLWLLQWEKQRMMVIWCGGKVSVSGTSSY